MVARWSQLGEPRLAVDDLDEPFEHDVEVAGAVPLLHDGLARGDLELAGDLDDRGASIVVERGEHRHVEEDVSVERAPPEATLPDRELPSEG